MVRIIKAKVLIKVPLRAKINSPPTGHLSLLVLLKAFPKILPGSPPKAPPRVLIKASLTVKVLLLLPYSHLPPTPHILAVHKICISHLLSNTSPAASLGILSGSQYGSPFFSTLDWVLPPTLLRPFSTGDGFPSSPTPFRRVLPYPWIPPFPSPPLLLSPLCTSPVLSLTSPSLFVASLGILSGSPLFSSLLLLYFPSLLPPFTPFLLFRFSSPRPFPCLSRCLPKEASPKVAAPYVAITQRGRLPPCWELFALAPPMIFSCLHAPFLCAAYGPGVNYVAGCCGPPAHF